MKVTVASMFAFAIGGLIIFLATPVGEPPTRMLPLQFDPPALGNQEDEPGEEKDSDRVVLDNEPDNATGDIAAKAHRLGVTILNSKPADKEALKQGLALLEQAVKLQPENSSFQIDLADAYYREGSNLSILLAMELYENLLVTESMHDAILTRLAYCYAKLENYQAAMGVAGKRVENSRIKAFPIASQIIEFALESGDVNTGREYLEFLVQQRPDEPEVNFLLAVLLKQAGDNEKANSLMVSTAEKMPKDSPYQEAVKRILQRDAK